MQSFNMIIKKVKIKASGYLVNDGVFVPLVRGNRHYKLVKEWLEENEPEPEYTTQELEDKERETSKDKVKSIKVALDNGIELSGNREAQADLVAMLTVLPSGETVPWPQINGSLVILTKEELFTALDMAVREMITLIST